MEFQLYTRNDVQNQGHYSIMTAQFQLQPFFVFLWKCFESNENCFILKE